MLRFANTASLAASFSGPESSPSWRGPGTPSARFLALALLFMVLAPFSAESQILNRVRSRVQQEISQGIEDAAARAARRAVNAAEDAIVCALTDQRCIETARADGREVIILDADNNVVGHENVPASRQATPPAAASPAQAPAPATAPVLRPGEGAWANYDFVPGDRVLFFDDFTEDFVGDFPRRLEFRSGAIEIVEWQDARFVRIGSRDAAFDVILPEVLPERFTLEFDVFMGDYANWLYVYPVDAEGRRAGENFAATRTNFGLGINASTSDGVNGGQLIPRMRTDVVPVRLMADGSYVKMFGGEQRVANIPNADLGRSQRLRFEFEDIDEQNPMLIGPIRIASGGREMLYDRLVREGRVITGGILFALGSADLLPESTPTLNDLIRALGQDSNLRVRIEGHTDSTGNADSNKRLSEARARAVVAYLTQEGGIAASRLEAVGMGPDHPVADNATAEGRQTNRRVELVVIR